MKTKCALEQSILEQKCDTLLKENEICFVGLINPMGILVAGGFKSCIGSLQDEAERQKMYMELVMQVSVRKDFDYRLGQVRYSASRREKAVMMSFSIDSFVLLISAEPNVNIDRTAHKIIKTVSLS
ncbi:MAG TPA: DUF6659 family protein [Candidatus Nitrosotenuis sp.]|nr:DUF6659 family protein [Candidatus Nitrosotenuis sp.]